MLTNADIFGGRGSAKCWYKAKNAYSSHKKSSKVYIFRENRRKKRKKKKLKKKNKKAKIKKKKKLEKIKISRKIKKI